MSSNIRYEAKYLSEIELEKKVNFKIDRENYIIEVIDNKINTLDRHTLFKKYGCITLMNGFSIALGVDINDYIDVAHSIYSVIKIEQDSVNRYSIYRNRGGYCDTTRLCSLYTYRNIIKAIKFSHTKEIKKLTLFDTLGAVYKTGISSSKDIKYVMRLMDEPNLAYSEEWDVYYDVGGIKVLVNKKTSYIDGMYIDSK